MELHSLSGNLSCSESQELLSDLIDVRRGELPHPDGSRLAEPRLRSALELHLAGCPACQNELKFMEEAGLAFSEFAVSELPSQHFADYGAKARARMSGKRAEVIPFPARKTSRRWMVATASLAAAACVAFVVGRSYVFNDSTNRLATAPIKAIVDPDTGKKLTLLSTPIAETRLSVRRPQEDGILQASEFLLNPSDSSSYDKLKADEGRFGYLIFGEKTAPDARPLLGVYLKTTRDVDRVKESNTLPIGLMVWNVQPGSPAAMLGLRQGDFIIQANDMAFENGSADEAARFLAAISGAEPGSQIQLHIVRPMGSQYVYLKPKVGLLGRYE